MTNFDDFLLWEAKSRDTIDFKKIYVDIAGDLVAGLLLSQVIYWYLPDSQGKSKLRVQKDDHLWIAKGREDWWEEIRITAKQFDRACKILVSKGILIKDYFMFDGFRTVHIRLDHDQFMALWNDQISEQGVRPVLPKGKDRVLPKVKTGSDERVRPITETTSKTTTESMPPSGENDFSDLFGAETSSNQNPNGKPATLAEDEAAHLQTFGVLPGQNVDPATYEVEQEIISAGWDIYHDDVKRGIIYFALAVRVHHPEFGLPNDTETRKDWYKSINGHLQNYSLAELQKLYKQAIIKMRAAELSYWRPGSLTKWALPEVAMQTQPKTIRTDDGDSGFYI